MRLRPASLPKRPGEAIPNTLPIEPLTGRATTARRPDLQGSPLWKPNGGLLPGRAACIQRERSARRNRECPVARNTAKIRQNYIGLLRLRLRAAESMLRSPCHPALLFSPQMGRLRFSVPHPSPHGSIETLDEFDTTA